MSKLNRQVAEHLWTAHSWRFTAKQVDGPEHLARVCDDLAGNHALEHHPGAFNGQPTWRRHDHDPVLADALEQRP